MFYTDLNQCLLPLPDSTSLNIAQICERIAEMKQKEIESNVENCYLNLTILYNITKNGSNT